MIRHHLSMLLMFIWEVTVFSTMVHLLIDKGESITIDVVLYYCILYIYSHFNLIICLIRIALQKFFFPNDYIVRPVDKVPQPGEKRLVMILSS